MGRRPKLRVSYGNDAQFLMRLEKAVADDDSRPKEWRTQVCRKLRDLAVDLVQAPEPKHFSENG